MSSHGIGPKLIDSIKVANISGVLAFNIQDGWFIKGAATFPRRNIRH